MSDQYPSDPQVNPPLNVQLSLAGATLFAMTRYVECPCAENAALVARHLECAAEQDAGEGSDKRLSDLCSALAFRWRGRILQQLTSEQIREQMIKAH